MHGEAGAGTEASPSNKIQTHSHMQRVEYSIVLEEKQE